MVPNILCLWLSFPVDLFFIFVGMSRLNQSSSLSLFHHFVSFFYWNTIDRCSSQLIFVAKREKENLSGVFNIIAQIAMRIECRIEWKIIFNCETAIYKTKFLFYLKKLKFHSDISIDNIIYKVSGILFSTFITTFDAVYCY